MTISASVETASTDSQASYKRNLVRFAAGTTWVSLGHPDSSFSMLTIVFKQRITEILPRENLQESLKCTLGKPQIFGQILLQVLSCEDI